MNGIVKTNYTVHRINRVPEESLIRHSYNFYFNFIQIVFIIHYYMNDEVRFHFRTKCNAQLLPFISLFLFQLISIGKFSGLLHLYRYRVHLLLLPFCANIKLEKRCFMYIVGSSINSYTNFIGLLQEFLQILTFNKFFVFPQFLN